MAVSLYLLFCKLLNADFTVQKQWKIDQNWTFVVIVVYGVGHSSIKTLQETQHFTSIVRFVMMKFFSIVINMLMYFILYLHLKVAFLRNLWNSYTLKDYFLKI